MDTTELIIFDLGRVLVDFDFKLVIRTLLKHSSLNEEQIHHFFQTTPLWDKFERGLVTPELFYETVRKELTLTGLDFIAFTTLWNSIFKEKADTLEVVQKLRGRYRLAILSNVNVMHWEHIVAQHPFIAWFDHPVASYAVGHRKPNPEAFHAVLKQANMLPQQAVFFDDIESHVIGAKALGIKAFQFTTAEQMIKDLGKLL